MADNEKLDLILTKIESIDGRLDKVDERLDKIDGRLDKVDERLDKIDERLDKMDERFDRVETRLDHLETDVKDIKLTIENEVRVNIRRIAEGHLDLARNLQKAIKPSNEVEMLSIQVRMLETDVREIKRKIS